MDADAAPTSPAEAEWLASQPKWTHGWRRLVMHAVPLVFLLYTVGDVGKFSRGADAAWGYAILATFSVCYLVAIAPTSLADSRRFWALYGVLIALLVGELPFAHAGAFVLCVFVAIITVIRLEARAVPIVLALALAAFVVPVVIPSWHDSIGTTIQVVTPIMILIVTLTVFVSSQVVRSNQELAEARADLERLAAENERIRIARDLHDLLGHSLTTITVKAGLARRLGNSDPTRANQEIAEVEALARRSLADVRAAVTSYRDVTLVQELAAGRELLRAAGITADLPRSVEVVDPAHQELFGWVVREGLTNIVRHSHASSCAVRLAASSVEIVDDGVGITGPPGNGLSGLRERVAAAGGFIDAGPRHPQGWRLWVSLSPEGGTW